MPIVTSVLAISDIDKRSFHYLSSLSLRHNWVPIAKKISFTGDGPLYLLLTLVLLVIHGEGEVFFETVLAAFIIELPLYLLLKNTIRRTRPCHISAVIIECDKVRDTQKIENELLPTLDFEPSDKFSLPSGHTAAAFVMATTISRVYPQWMWLAYFWALAIGLSRVFLGVHYPLDIIAGAVLGGSSVYLVQSFV